MRAVQHTRRAAAALREPRRMLTEAATFTACFNADQSHAFVAHEPVKEANRIRAAANARNQHIRQFPFTPNELSPCLVANDCLKLADHQWIRVRPERAA